MATTANFSWTKATVGGDSGAWGAIVNAIVDAIDQKLWDTLHPLRSDLGSVSGTATLDLSSAEAFTLTVGGNVSLVPANVPSGARLAAMLLKITNGGSATVTWPTGTKWPSGAAPSLTVAGVDVVVLTSFDGGTTWNAVLAQKDSR